MYAISYYLGILSVPPFHEFPELLGVPGGVDDVHVELAMPHFVVEVDWPDPSL